MKAKNKKFQKFITLLLTFSLIFSCFAVYSAAEEVENPSKVRVYIRAFDYNNNTELTLEKQGKWIGNCYSTAFPDADVLVSTARLTKQQFYDELDEFFKDADDNDINFICFTGHGSSDGYIFLHNKSGTKLSEIRKNHIDNIPGKIFLFVSACCCGRWIDTDFTGSQYKTFRAEVDSYGSKYSILMDGEGESTYIPGGEGPGTETNGKWADGLTVTTDEYGCKHIKADRNDDGELTLNELYLYGLSKPNSFDSMRYPLYDNTVVFSISDYGVVFDACEGSFENGDEWYTVYSTDTPIIESAPVPEKDGLTFDGWYTKAVGGEKVTFPLEINANLKLWAHWAKDGTQDLSRAVSQWDTLRIPLTDGTYTDFLIINKTQTCNSYKLSSMNCTSDTGMLVIAKSFSGTVQYCDSIDDLGNWEKSNVRARCERYYNCLPKEVQQLVLDTTVSLPEGKTSTEKVYIFSSTETNKCLTKDIISQIITSRTWERIVSSSTLLPFLNKSGSHSALSETSSNLKSANFPIRPVMNLSVTEDDLIYNFETKAYELKSLQGVDIKVDFNGVDKTYYITKNGEIVYTATGERDAVCDQMNTMAMVPWSLTEPIYYNYMGNLRSAMQAGTYRGIPYANTYDRDFHYIDRIDECFAEGETKVRGLECSSAVVYGLRDGLKLTDADNELIKNGSAYTCRDFIADGLHEGTGSMKSIGGSLFTYSDCLTYVGDYGSYVISDESPDTEFIIKGIIETANYNDGTIYDNVYAKIKPGDALIRHYDDIVGDTNVSSHAQLCTGVNLVYNDKGYIDPDKSTVSFVDISAPHNSILTTTGEYTAWTTDDTQKSNKMTFRYMTDSVFVIPLTMNRWLDDTSNPHHTIEKVEKNAPACTVAGNIEYFKCNGCGLLFGNAAGTEVIEAGAVIIPETGHNFVDGFCTVCGNVDPDYEIPDDQSSCLLLRIFKKIINFFKRIFSKL